MYLSIVASALPTPQEIQIYTSKKVKMDWTSKKQKENTLNYTLGYVWNFVINDTEVKLKLLQKRTDCNIMQTTNPIM